MQNDISNELLSHIEEIKNAAPKKVKKKTSNATKGKNYEREICTQIAHIFPDARRHLEYHWKDALKKMDIQGTKPWVIQCKRTRKYVNPKILLETIAEKDEIRVLLTKADGLPDMAVIEWKNFKTLLEIAHGLREPFRSVAELTDEKAKLNIKNLPPFNNGCMEDLGL